MQIVVSTEATMLFERIQLNVHVVRDGFLAQALWRARRRLKSGLGQRLFAVRSPILTKHVGASPPPPSAPLARP